MIKNFLMFCLIAFVSFVFMSAPATINGKDTIVTNFVEET